MNLKDHFGMNNNGFLSGITYMFFNSFYHDELTKNSLSKVNVDQSNQIFLKNFLEIIYERIFT